MSNGRNGSKGSKAGKGSKRRKGGLGGNPLDSVIPATSQEPQDPPAKEKMRTTQRVRFTVQLPEDLVEQLRDVAYEDRVTLTDLTQDALAGLLRRLEKERGEPYPKRSGKVKTGRPVGR